MFGYAKFSLDYLKRSVSSYIRDKRGAAAVVFALTIPAVVGSVGLSVDLARSYLAKERLSHALDAAALAAGSSTGLSGSTLTARMQAFLHKNYDPSAEGSIFNVTLIEVNGKVQVSGSVELETLFMGLLGIDVITVHAYTEVTKALSRSIELAMVLDLSGSMSGTKLSALKTSALSLVSTIVVDGQLADGPYAKVAIVPYSMGVNVGSYASQVRGSYTSGTSTNPGYQYFKFVNNSGSYKTFQISNCVSERTGTHAYNDTAPSTSFVGRNYPSSANPCLSSQIIPLTSNKTTLNNSINAFTATGSTAGHIGVAWGWYLLSPNFSYLFPSGRGAAAYDSDNLHKVVVLMSDGENNSPYCKGVISKDSGSGSGSGSERINCNATNGSSNYQMGQLCTAMKAQGIKIYTIGFDIADLTSAQAALESCATDESHYYLADDNEELQRAFNDIAGKVRDLYISN